jgi:long-chain acyl-CoA synthetase
MLVQDFLQDSARRLPEKIALVCEGKRWTYSQLDAMANRLANAFLRYGLKRGERVGLWLGNSLEAVVGIFAILKAGGVFVPLYPGLKLEKLAYILNNCQAAGLISDKRRLAALVTGRADILPSRPQDRSQERTPHPDLLPFRRGEGEERCLPM